MFKYHCVTHGHGSAFAGRHYLYLGPLALVWITDRACYKPNGLEVMTKDFAEKVERHPEAGPGLNYARETIWKGRVIIYRLKEKLQ